MPRPLKKLKGVYEYPKSSGVWYARWQGSDGLLHKRKFGPGPGARELAIDCHRQMALLAKEGRDFPLRQRRAVSFREIVRDFLEYSRANKRSAKDDVKRMNYWLGAFGDKAVESVTPQDIERHKEALAQEYALATVNRYLAALKTSYSLAVRNGKVERNPVKAVKLFKENNARVRYLTEQEEAKLMAALPPYFRPLAYLALHTGLRRGELLALRWEDVDFRTGTLTVRRSKHGEARHVPLNRVACETLLALKRERKVLAPYVFTTEAGRYLHNFERSFIRAVKMAGLENFHFHDLRHTFASRLAMRGVPLRTVQELMGHKTVAMTLRYSHLSPAHLRDAVEGLCEGVHPESRQGRDERVLGGITVPPTVPGPFSGFDSPAQEPAKYAE